ncbi:MAG: heavy metal translocating P-type ATPase, partial [Deltaproteobacteria bacterium HGW-Deltaproteobacteria-10]
MDEKVTFAVSGMTCATCVRRLEEGLRQMPGVRKAEVNFATEKASVEYEADIVDINALQNKVRDLGYEAFVDASAAASPPGKVTISVGGMTCAACVRRVENALREVEGVQDASVNMATARATVNHAAKWAGLAALEKAIVDQGYQYLGEIQDFLPDPAEAARISELKELKLKVTCGAILSIIIFFG